MVKEKLRVQRELRLVRTYYVHMLHNYTEVTCTKIHDFYTEFLKIVHESKSYYIGKNRARDSVSRHVFPYVAEGRVPMLRTRGVIIER
jgi:hypothetical protein